MWLIRKSLVETHFTSGPSHACDAIHRESTKNGLSLYLKGLDFTHIAKVIKYRSHKIWYLQLHFLHRMSRKLHPLFSQENERLYSSLTQLQKELKLSQSRLYEDNEKLRKELLDARYVRDILASRQFFH